jgi:hypothetical protein
MTSIPARAMVRVDPHATTAALTNDHSGCLHSNAHETAGRDAHAGRSSGQTYAYHFALVYDCLQFPDGMEKVVCVPQAKVRIVKIWDPELGLACDMNVNNTLALENTRMIKTYVNIDERVRPLAMIVKHWTKQRILNDAGKELAITSLLQLTTC